MSDNYRETAKVFLKQLNKTGFHKVRVTTDLEGEDYPEDGETQVTKDEFNKDYAIFVIEPLFEPFFEPSVNEYITVEYNTHLFWDDLKAHIQNVFGKDAEITFREGCSEFEIIRKVVKNV